MTITILLAFITAQLSVGTIKASKSPATLICRALAVAIRAAIRSRPFLIARSRQLLDAAVTRFALHIPRGNARIPGLVIAGLAFIAAQQLLFLAIAELSAFKALDLVPFIGKRPHGIASFVSLTLPVAV